MTYDDPLDLAVEMRQYAQRLLESAARIEEQHRTRRMERIAETLLRAREPRAEISKILVARFGVSRQYAYRLIERALNEMTP